MHRPLDANEVYSIVFVDFDNIYTRLHEINPELAHSFGTNPQRWMKWLEGHAIRMLYGEGIRRRILKRCCYLNPKVYHEYRPYFIRAAFQVIDCPPLTNQGKTSADIHLVMDSLDALHHSTYFDEFFILSGDADFTPLLLRLQEYARRSLVLSIGYTSPAYAAACTWRIREDWFMTQALADYTEEAHGKQASSMQDDWQQRPQTGSHSGLPKQFSTDKAKRSAEIIRSLVAGSDAPVTIPTIAQALQSELEPGPDWFGFGRLRDVIANLPLSPLEYSAVPPGFVFDPERHDRPEDSDIRENFKSLYPHLYELALKVHRLTDTPLLQPDFLQTLLSYARKEIETNGFKAIETAAKIHKKSRDNALPITIPQISFILSGIIRGGCQLSTKKVTESAMSKAFLDYLLELCHMTQLSLSEEEEIFMEQWILTPNKKSDKK